VKLELGSVHERSVKQLAAKKIVEALMLPASPAIVGAGRCSRERRCVHREGAQGKRLAEAPASLPHLAAVAAQLGVASDGRSHGIRRAGDPRSQRRPRLND
jgi:hypothetical protein